IPCLHLVVTDWRTKVTKIFVFQWIKFPSRGIPFWNTIGQMNKVFSLEGETALITGGGSGLGLGMATCFVEAGAKVVLVGRRADVLEASAKKLGPNAFAEAHDITKLDQAGALIERATKRVGPISILVNNAGVHLKKSAVDSTPEEFAAVLQTHVMAAFA